MQIFQSAARAAVLLLAFGALAASSGQTVVTSRNINRLILEQIDSMPVGGAYATTHEATLRLQEAARLEEGKLSVEAAAAAPTYCSGATYLVFLKVIETLRSEGALQLDPDTLGRLLIRGQADGQGIWGRWNANGPGTARLFRELRLGTNFSDFGQAQRGDFMKIFWTSEVGAAEHGHSVIFLGLENRGGAEWVHFWSSNKPGGYGEKAVPMARISHAIFSRLETPENLSRAAALPASDSYLASLQRRRSSFEEAAAKCGFTPP